MPKTNPKQKGARKPTQRNPYTLAQLSEQVDNLYTARAFDLEHFAKMNNRLDALESRLPAQEQETAKWVPKVDEVLVLVSNPTLLFKVIHAPDELGFSLTTESLSPTRQQYYGQPVSIYRPATPSEIAAHKEAEEERKRKEEEAAELAKPIEFGTPIEHSSRGKGVYMGMDGILYELAFLSHGPNRMHQWSTILCPRLSFTIIK